MIGRRGPAAARELPSPASVESAEQATLARRASKAPKPSLWERAPIFVSLTTAVIATSISVQAFWMQKVNQQRQDDEQRRQRIEKYLDWATTTGSDALGRRLAGTLALRTTWGQGWDDLMVPTLSTLLLSEEEPVRQAAMQVLAAPFSAGCPAPLKAAILGGQAGSAAGFGLQALYKIQDMKDLGPSEQKRATAIGLFERLRSCLGGANLARANLSGANLAGADLTGSEMAEADLRGVDLSGAHIEFDRLKTTSASWFVNLAKTDISGATSAGEVQAWASAHCSLDAPPAEYQEWMKDIKSANNYALRARLDEKSCQAWIEHGRPLREGSKVPALDD